MRVLIPAWLERTCPREERLGFTTLHHAKARPTSSINSSTRLLRKGGKGGGLRAHKGDAVARCLHEDLMMRLWCLAVKGEEVEERCQSPI